MLRDFFLRQRRAYGTAILCLLGVGLLNLTLPWWIGKAIDALRAGELDQTGLLWRVALIVAGGGGLYVVRYQWRVRLFGTSYPVGVELRDAVFAKPCAPGPGFFPSMCDGELLGL